MFDITKDITRLISDREHDLVPFLIQLSYSILQTECVALRYNHNYGIV